MPSVLIGAISGGQQIISGNPWSGQFLPRGEIQFRNSPDNVSGVIYIGLSGGITINSGTGSLNPGLMDATPLALGDTYSIPAQALVKGLGLSGITGSGYFNIFAATLPLVSGLMRLVFEVF